MRDMEAGGILFFNFIIILHVADFKMPEFLQRMTYRLGDAT